MTVKQIWGIVLIVLGVIFTLSSLSIIFDLYAVDHVMSSMPKVKTGVASLDGVVSDFNRQYRDASSNAKAFSVLRGGFGLILAYLGTLLFRADQKPIADFDDEEQI